VISGHCLCGCRVELALKRVQHILYSGNGSGSDSPGPAGGTSAAQTPAGQQAAAKRARRLKCARFWLAHFRKSAAESRLQARRQCGFADAEKLAVVVLAGSLMCAVGLRVVSLRERLQNACQLVRGLKQGCP
jgi:hypothetical protein